MKQLSVILILITLSVVVYYNFGRSMLPFGTERIVKEQVSLILQIDTANIPIDAHLINDLGADELDMIEIFSNLEEKIISARFPDDCYKFTTVHEIADYIDRNR